MSAAPRLLARLCRLTVGLALQVQTEGAGLAFGLSFQLAASNALKLKLPLVWRVLPPSGYRCLGYVESESQGRLTAIELNRLFLAHEPFYSHAYQQRKP